jgi:hypothetical protein
MAKLVFSVLMIVIWWMLHALQMDEELAMGMVHEGKRAVDRAAHAAAQQLDRDKLEMGMLSIKPELAEQSVLAYLRENLTLDAGLNPLPGSFLKDPPEIRVFKVVNDDVTYPFTYRNSLYQYEITLDRPSVILIIHIKYPRLFGVLTPVEWDLKGSAELVY